MSRCRLITNERSTEHNVYYSCGFAYQLFVNDRKMLKLELNFIHGFLYNQLFYQWQKKKPWTFEFNKLQSYIVANTYYNDNGNIIIINKRPYTLVPLIKAYKSFKRDQATMEKSRLHHSQLLSRNNVYQ